MRNLQHDNYNPSTPHFPNHNNPTSPPSSAAITTMAMSKYETIIWEEKMKDQILCELPTHLP